METKKAVVVTGARDAKERDWTPAVLKRLTEVAPEAVIHGAQGGTDKKIGLFGIDTIADAVAFGIVREAVLRFPFERGLGKAGGPVRNRKMLAHLVLCREDGYDVQVEAFHDDLFASKGTFDMCYQAAKAGVPVYLTDRSGTTVAVDPETLIAEKKRRKAGKKR